KQLHKKMKLIPGSGSPSGFTSRFSLVTCSLISVRAAQVWVKKHANFRFRMFRFSFRFHIQVPNPLTSIDQTASVRAVHVEEAREEVILPYTYPDSSLSDRTPAIPFSVRARDQRSIE
ncbi:hypothetical protein PRIPAC_85733, partial [Pristionchus pacificus]|uniref:Uncharacterized protein n=1 Tax=Pristionchus pacificus TaxID=54126 RepID=A0A2A6BLM7_PRIPA